MTAAETTRVRRHRMADPGGYIGGLDGLRALAVASVVIYHITPGALPGGFLGVDVFFVVSGFLITTLLLREVRKTKKIDFIGFWRRRARRLVPALVFLVIIVVPIAGIINRDLLVGIGRQVLGALTFSSNWLEIANGSSYFDQTSPLLFKNFWSLAVEEQFYLVWPPLFLLVIMLVRSWRVRVGMAVGLALLSAVLMGVMADPENLTRVYYGTDTHLFGLALGIALAFSWAPASGTWLAGRWSAWSQVAGLAALGGLLLLMATLDDQSLFTYRGGILLASLLTLTIIAAMIAPASPIARAAENPIFHWIGTRSYALYLWHWPVLVMVGLLAPAAPGSTAFWIRSAVAVLLTGIICEFSYRVIETPIRTNGFRATLAAASSRVSTRQPRYLAIVAAAAIMLVGTGAAVALAPEKSSVQLEIEENEERFETTPADPTPQPSEGADSPEPDASAAPTESSPQGFAMPGGEDITAIGDSLIVTSADGLEVEFPGLNFIAKSNRQWHEAPALVEAGLRDGTIRRAVILDFGTNAGIPDPQIVRDTIDLLGPDRMIVLVTIYGQSTFIESANETIRDIAADYPNVAVADWHAAISAQPHLLQADQTHPDIGGMYLFAETVRTAFETLAS
ncbi:acyltransferase family protein [Flaviflexus equikiangi]|uniref:Acyltransferase n=1 Tax=Flaviflexus equikiangi TaxID=2758573 RepID=A0ABS2TEB0_9ACTO|nr:acyltransferase family protein [Flaviflexus equikiangi]MBM9432972.1 acyltransferase [Flaviflexus equikiangi]